MNERLTIMKNRVRDGAHHPLQQEVPIEILTECETRQSSWPRRVAYLVRRQCETERVIIEPLHAHCIYLGDLWLFVDGV
jgi:hypothetical protein